VDLKFHDCGDLMTTFYLLTKKLFAFNVTIVTMEIVTVLSVCFSLMAPTAHNLDYRSIVEMTMLHSL